MPVDKLPRIPSIHQPLGHSPQPPRPSHTASARAARQGGGSSARVGASTPTKSVASSGMLAPPAGPEVLAHREPVTVSASTSGDCAIAPAPTVGDGWRRCYKAAGEIEAMRRCLQGAATRSLYSQCRRSCYSSLQLTKARYSSLQLVWLVYTARLHPSQRDRQSPRTSRPDMHNTPRATASASGRERSTHSQLSSSTAS